MKTCPPLRRPAGSPGVALIITLMMMAVLTLMVVGLAGVMRNEQAAARNLTYQMLAEQLAQVGAQEAMQKVMANSPVASANEVLSSGPGWLASGTNLIPLFLTNRTGELPNLEAIGTNSLILGLMPGTTGRIEAGWSNVVSPVQVSTQAATIGRFSWWVDDEGSKLNLNAVGFHPNTRVPLPFSRNVCPWSGEFLFANPVNGQVTVQEARLGQAVAVRSNFFPTTESLKDTNLTASTNVTGALYGRAKGQITAFSQSADLTPWGAPKISLTDAALTAAQIKAVLTRNFWTNFSTANGSLAKKYGGGTTTATNAGNHGDLVMEQIAKNFLAAQGRPFVCTNFGGRRDFLAADHPNRHRNGLPREIASHYLGPYLEEIRVRVDGAVGGGASITGRLGILVQVVNPYDQAFSDFTLVVQPRKFRFQVRPAPNQILLDGDIQNATSGSPLNGFVGPRSAQSDVNAGPGWYIGPEWYNNRIEPWPTNSPFITTIASIGPRSRRSYVFEQRISFTLGNNKIAQGMGNAYVILDSVKLCRGLNNTTDVIDWVSLDDFSQPGNYENNRSGALSDIGQLNLIATTQAGLTDLSEGNFGGLAGNTLGLRRIDPQARFSVPFWSPSDRLSNRGLLKENSGWPNSMQAWTRNANLPVSSLVTNTGIPYLAADPAPSNLTDILNHPHFVPGFYTTNGMNSVAQLGAIHTGIPWRTLRLQPTSSNELAQGPPDWILLDAFTALNPLRTDLPMLNLNSLTLGQGSGQVAVVTNSDGRTPIRTWAVLGALGVWTTNNYQTNLFASNGIPATVTTNLVDYRSYLPTVATNLQAVLTNSSASNAWSVNSGWSQQRGGPLRQTMPRYGLGLRGEILELRGVAEGLTETLSEDVVEGRLRAYLDLLTTRSDTFSVWSVGQALAISGSTTNVMAEIRKQTVFRRVPRFQNNQLQGYDLEMVYTRNHMVE